MPERENTCCFTGHREYKLPWGSDENDPRCRKLQQQTEQVAEKIAALAKEIHSLAGREFNISSPKQLGEVLFEDLKLPVIKKTKTGYSTNVEVLNELYNQHPIIGKILDSVDRRSLISYPVVIMQFFYYFVAISSLPSAGNSYEQDEFWAIIHTFTSIL